LDRYIFDRKLRLLLLDAIERIEVAIRSSLSNSIALEHGSHWYLNGGIFQEEFNHDSFISELRRQIGHNGNNQNHIRRRTKSIKHYYDNYNNPDMPPSWVVFEEVSFGLISRLFEGLYKSETVHIRADYKISHDVFSSWLHSISYIRNLCAHHSRLWNKTLVTKPKIAKYYADKFNGNSKIYSVIVVIQIILEKISPDNTLLARLKDLLAKYPETPIAEMGFPENWVDS